MSCAIIASAVKCALGSTLSQSLENLSRCEVLSSRVELDILEESVDAPYFLISDPYPDQAGNYATTLSTLLTELIADGAMSRRELARTGLFLGSSSFTVADSEQQFFSSIASAAAHPLPMPIVGYNKLAENLAREFELSSQVYSYATACTSSANAVLYADKLIQSGDIDHALVIGCEFQNSTSLLGFYGLELLSAQARILPFDERRDGLILGEACAAVLLSGKKSCGSSLRFAGGACNTDIHSLTAANTDGSSIADVIHRAIVSAGASPETVRAIKAHGTASLLNDEAEAAGILSVFAAIPTPSVFALKPYIGHSLGACGVVELALLIGALEAGFVPCNKGIAENSSLGLSLTQENQKAESGHYLLNYFAFGGNNVSLLVEQG